MTAQVLRKAKLIFDMFNWRELTARPSRCPRCGPTIFVRLNRSDWGVRCARCTSAPNTLSIIDSLNKHCGGPVGKTVYVLSTVGPLLNYLRSNVKRLTCSVYDERIEPGTFHNGVQCQDVQHLTFADNSFDLCIHSEVFEHVPDDRQGFREIHRVLKPGGFTVFTVPLFNTYATLERATLINGEVKHLLPPSYHDDQFRGRVLAFRDYGHDILERLREANFTNIKLHPPFVPKGVDYVCEGFARPAIVARKAL